MLNNINLYTVARLTVLGAAAGAVIGSGSAIPSIIDGRLKKICENMLELNLDLNDPLHKDPAFIDGFMTACTPVQMFVKALDYVVAGATIGLIYGVSVEILKNHGIELNFHW